MLKATLLPVGLLAVVCSAQAAETPGGQAAPQQRAASSQITNVTIYQNNALVTREVTVPEGLGSLELVVTPLPPQTIDSSLYSEGTDGIRVLTTRYRMRPIKEDTREEVRKLEAQIKQLTLAAQKLQGEIKTVEQNLQLLAKLEGFTATGTTHASEKGALNSESSISLTKYVMDQRGEKSKQLVTLQQQLQANTEQAEFAKRQLQELAAGTSKTERDAVIVVDKRNAAAGKVRLNYLVDSAFWRPQYKLRGSNNDKEPVQLEYLAAIVQQSGEDWSNVNLILSTAQPMLNAAPPELKMLEITVVPRASAAGQPGPGGKVESYAGFAPNSSPEVIFQQAQTLRGKAQKELNFNNTLDGSKLYNEAAALEQQRDLLQSKDDVLVALKGRAGASSGDEGPSVAYHLRSKLSVPSRKDEQVIEVAKIDMAPEYYFKAVPVLTSHVYRLANLTNKSEYVLLPGQATMYLGSDFVGRMNLPLVAIGEQFTAGFGIDPQLQIQRELVDKSRTTQGGNQVLKYAYRILIHSYKPQPVKLQVWDRLPRAENETAGVNLIKTSPEISTDSLFLREQRPHNLLRWDLTVEPTMNGEKAMAIHYEFKVEVDRQMLIGNFLTK